MRVAIEQFASSAAPRVLPSGSMNCCVWQKKGVWCGPETIGPSIGQLRTLTVATAAPPPTGTTAGALVLRATPGPPPGTLRDNFGGSRDFWSLPAATILTPLAAVPAGSATCTSALPPL